MKHPRLALLLCALGLTACGLDNGPDAVLRGTFPMVQYDGSALPTVAYDFPRYDRWGQPLAQHCSAVVEAGELEVMVHPPWVHLDTRLISSCTGEHLRTSRFTGEFVQTGRNTFDIVGRRRDPDEPIVLHARVDAGRVVVSGPTTSYVFSR